AFPLGFDNTQKTEILRGTIAVDAAAATYATGGLALSLASSEVLKSSSAPIQVRVWSAAGSGYVYAYNAAAATLQIFLCGGSGSPLIELGGNTTQIPDGVSGDTIQFEAIFPKFI